MPALPGRGGQGGSAGAWSVANSIQTVSGVRVWGVQSGPGRNEHIQTVVKWGWWRAGTAPQPQPSRLATAVPRTRRGGPSALLRRAAALSAPRSWARGLGGRRQVWVHGGVCLALLGGVVGVECQHTVALQALGVVCRRLVRLPLRLLHHQQHLEAGGWVGGVVRLGCGLGQARQRCQKAGDQVG